MNILWSVLLNFAILHSSMPIVVESVSLEPLLSWLQKYWYDETFPYKSRDILLK